MLLFILSASASIRNLEANSFYYNLILFNTDKSAYYYDEFMEINALWELNYDNDLEISYIQIQIFGINDSLLFNSSKFYDTGISAKNWTIELQKLEFTFENSSYILFIKALNSYKNLNVGTPELTILDSIRVVILKRNISCEVTGYRSNIKYGENLSLIAKLSSPDKERDLSNQSVEVKIISKNIVNYKAYYITNSSGKFTFQIFSIYHLNLGLNLLIINITDSDLFKDSFFTYNITVEKYQIFAEVIYFNSRIQLNEDIQLELLYYYNNNSIHPLKNETINVAIYTNSLLKFKENFKTNNSGLLKVNIFYELLEFEPDQRTLLINLFFNGSRFLQNYTLSFSLEINYNENQMNFLTVEFTLVSLVGFLLIGFSIFVYKKRRAKNQLIKDISFKY
ncbi:MAG: hypothetical protein ACFE8E_07375 [Candidatus Hodarchaeota archaeon]